MLREYNKLDGAAPRIDSVHHLAFRCRDAEETRRFYEEALQCPCPDCDVA